MKVFGYSRDADSSMLVPEGVNYLQTGHKQLLKYFAKHKLKFDVIYSDGGLKNVSAFELPDYLVSLKEHLHVGGMIFPDLVWTSYRHREIFANLQKEGFELGFVHGQLVSLTRVK